MGLFNQTAENDFKVSITAGPLLRSPVAPLGASCGTGILDFAGWLGCKGELG